MSVPISTRGGLHPAVSSLHEAPGRRRSPSGPSANRQPGPPDTGSPRPAIGRSGRLAWHALRYGLGSLSSLFHWPPAIPDSAPRRKELATLAAWMTFSLGRQAMLGQGPP